MDLRFRWGLQGADLEIEEGDLALDESLVTPALVSIFSDGRQTRGPKGAPETQDLRGWWAEEEADPFGSLLWTLARSKLSEATLEAARNQVIASLRWLVTEGIASSVTCVATRADPGGLKLDVELRRGPISRWSELWDATSRTEIKGAGVLLNLSAR